MIKWLFIVPIAFLIFSIATIFIKDISEKSMVKIKRFYYTLCLFGIIWIINKIDLSKITVANTFGIPQNIWVIFFIFIIGIAVSIVLNMLIISSTDIKEITLGWAKISKEEIKHNIEEQKLYVERLIDKIEAEHEVIQNFEKYLMDNRIEDKLRTDYTHFLWEEEFKCLIQFYCKHQNTNIDVYVLNNNDTDFELNLEVTFNMTSTNISTIKNNIQSNKSTPIVQKKSFLFIPYKPVYYSNTIIIVLKGKPEFVFDIEQRFILNIIKSFENYITDILANMISEDSVTP